MRAGRRRAREGFGWHLAKRRRGGWWWWKESPFEAKLRPPLQTVAKSVPVGSLRSALEGTGVNLADLAFNGRFFRSPALLRG